MTGHDSSTTALAEAYQAERPRLFGIAYRMTGSIAEAEDIVQDAWLRFEPAAHEPVRSPAALLTTIVTRLSVDHLRSARRQREQYIGPWLPEALHTRALAPDEDPERAVLQHEALDTAFLLLLEYLTPAERAVLVLTEALDLPHREIAQILGISEAGSRQHLRRARRRLEAHGGQPPIDRHEHGRMVGALVAALSAGDAVTVASLLSDDVVMHNDGGGVVAAARNLIHGSDRVIRFLLGVAAKYADYGMRHTEANGLPAVEIRHGDVLDTVMTLGIRDGRVASLYLLRNPEKLAHYGEPVAVR